MNKKAAVLTALDTNLSVRVLDQIPTPVMAVDRDFKIVFMNQAGRTLLGKSMEEIRKYKCSDLLNSLHCGTSECRMKKAIESGESGTARNQLVVDGKTIAIEYHAAPLKDDDGNIIGGVEYVVDTTEQDMINADYASQLMAIGKSQAVISFNMDGTILDANDNFLGAMGYRLDEVQGRHHSTFVESAQRDSDEYKEFWAALNRGEYQAGEFKRIGKGGREVWIQASYNPVLGIDGKPFKVVKFATDVTQQKLRNADFAGQVEAIGKSQAVISFTMDGTILTANDKFLAALGYRLEEVQGKHHSMFVEAAQRDSGEYKEFWAALNRGEFQAAEFKRIGKGGREVWIQASYNPILDLNGKPFKVVKYAADVTQRVRDEQKMREQSRTIMEISTPAISLWEGIVVLPVVGVVDSMRAQQMMNTMLAKIKETSAKIIILDIQGVAAVDTAVANHLIKITKATRLMGCNCLISGISPAVAETLVQLGIDLGGVSTNGTLKDSLGDAFEMLRYEVRRGK